MNKTLINGFMNELPYTLRDRINGYVDSVINSMDSIFLSAGIKHNDEIANKIILLSAIRKLFDIINAAYWTLDNTTNVLEKQGTTKIRIGGTNYSRFSEYYSNLFQMQDGLKQILEDQKIFDYVYNQSYSDIVKALANEH